MEQPASNSLQPVQMVLFAILGLTAIYAVVYQLQPLPGLWNDIYLNLMIAIPALLASIAALLAWRGFAPGDRPRPVWLAFGLGLLCWSLGEIAWLGIWLMQGEVTNIALPDLFWLAGLALFCLAFVLQYRVIYDFRRRAAILWPALALLAALIVAVLVTAALRSWANMPVEETWLESYLSVFYTVSDLALMLAALGLGYLFGRGLWGRAWLALLVLVISDVLYTYVNMSGLYAQSVENGNILTLVVDTTYSLAYILLALGCYGQYLLVRHGPTLRPSIEV